MDMSKQPIDVLIVGAGPVGMTLARALSGAGVGVEIIDRLAPAALTALPHDGRAWALAPASRRALQAIGVWPELAARAERMEARGDQAYQPVARQRQVSGALRAYAALTTSAAQGAVRDVGQLRR